MKTVVRYQADDGTIWETAQAARDYEAWTGGFGCVTDRRGSPPAVDADGVLDRFPAIRRGLDRWRADPAPRLARLRITLGGPNPFDPGPEVDIPIGMEWTDGQRACRVNRLVPTSDDGDTERKMVWTLEGMHGWIVAELRGQADRDRGDGH